MSSPAMLACTALTLLAGLEARGQEQYLVLNIIPGERYDSAFAQIQQLSAKTSFGRLRLGIGAIFSYLHEPMEQVKAQLLEFLSLSEKHDIPIVVQLDGEQWWEYRSDLWNWWDSTRSGYNPRNRWNVEWTGWGPEHAMKIAWRNWGRQIRVLPPPNLMSPAYRNACHDEMRYLVPLILEWWKNLPPEKQHLLLAVKLGWESSIGVNAFYYPHGNALLEKPESDDPQERLRAELVPDRGVVASGYAAVTTVRLADGGALQESHLAEVVRRHLDDLCALASDLGVPRERLFTHVGGWKEEELLYDAALNEHSCPGWSFYRHAGDAAQDMGVQRVLRRSDAPYWAAAEWMLEEKRDSASWYDAIVRTMAIPKCRYMCIYNWSGIREISGAVYAIRGVLAAPRK